MEEKLRNIMFVIIIIICIFAINFGVYWKFFRDTGAKNTINNETMQPVINTEEISKNFNTIFNNTIDYQGNNINIAGVTKIDQNRYLVYTLYRKKETIENKYDMDIQIPYINISSTIIEKFNKQINDVFVEKARNVLTQATNNTIYSVEYMSYINSNILSLVIKSNLKEGNNPQRVIIQTYNYNLSTNEEIKLNQILEIKGLYEQNVQERIYNKVEEANREAESLKNLGYNVFIRNLNSNIYDIRNTNNYFIGSNNKLYIIYPYGNSNFTDAMDVIVF